MRLKARYLILVLLAACFSTMAVAQKQHYFGKVLDNNTHTGIPDANLSISASKTGCTTDQNGEFSFYSDITPIFVTVSHLGYESLKIRLDKSSGGFTLLLKPVASLLREVEISAKNEPEPFFKDDQYSILDFVADSDLVYLLIYRFRLAKSQLLCKSVSGDTVACSGIITFRPAGLYRDCLGYIHVLSQDSAYQVFLEDDSLYFPYAFEIQKFYSTISDCVASTDDWLVFKEESFYHQVIDFYMVNRNSSQKQMLEKVTDKEKTNLLIKNPSDNFFMWLDTIPGDWEDFKEWSYVRQILYKPNASVLKRIGDTLCLFNTVDGTFNLYDTDGKIISHRKLIFHGNEKEDWTREIYADQISHKAYTSFAKNGNVILSRIDFNSGELTRVLHPVHQFPGKVTVQHSFLYYLYDIPGTGDNKRLYRQKIDF
jgi:hypothetical protein